MTSFRSSRHINSSKDDGSQPSSTWSRLSLRRHTTSKRNIPSESCVSGTSANSYLTEPASRHRRFGGALRHLASDSRLNDHYEDQKPVASSLSSHSRSHRSPSLTSDPRNLRSNNMAGMPDMDRSRNRPARTFVGNQCAVCEETLEHTFRNERVLQFSCSHVSHEACLYQFIKEVDAQFCPVCKAPLGLDSSRGGNVLDLEKLSNLVRSVSSAEGLREHPRERERERDIERERERERNRSRDTMSTVQHEPYGNRARSGSIQGSRTSSIARADSRVENRHDYREPHYRGYENGHQRNDSNASADYSEAPTTAVSYTRRHEYESTRSGESDVGPRTVSINHIPPPTVTLVNEFPTMTRSKVQQSLTCIITVKVGERKHNYTEGVITASSGSYDQFQSRGPREQEHAQYYDRQEAIDAQAREREAQREREAALATITDELRLRVENWHGLDFNRFGKLRLHGTIKVGKDCQAWQELECYLFSDMLICVKEKKVAASSQQWTNGGTAKKREKSVKCTLKGSILIKKHLQKVTDSSGQDSFILTLNLSVTELPQFHLCFPNQEQLEQWLQALLHLNSDAPPKSPHDDNRQMLQPEDEPLDYAASNRTPRRVSSVASGFSSGGGYGPGRASTTNGSIPSDIGASLHIPLDLIVVIPVSSSMQGLKINLLRDALKFIVQTLGEHDRLGLVTFGSSYGGDQLTSLETKRWPGWPKVISSVRPVGQKSLRADVVEGANVAMNLLMERKPGSSNPIASILLISDSSTSEGEGTDGVNFVVSRAEAAKITIHSFGLGLTHKPDTMIEMSTRTKGLYTYVKDWMVLRECLAGCVGALQSLSHQNAKLKLKIPEGSPARFVKISGALQASKRSSGREAEASLGDLRFGDKKDILVQLAISGDGNESEAAPQDAWESIVSGLEALGGPTEPEEDRTLSIDEVALIQADLVYGDIQRNGTSQSGPHLLIITTLPESNTNRNTNQPAEPMIPPNAMVVQRRMELLTSDMLTRSLFLVSRSQHDRAQVLLNETRTILRGLGKGALPPVPPPSSSQGLDDGIERSRTPINSASPLERNFAPAAWLDPVTVAALDSELESALEWINHPAVFSRDSRKAVLQAVGVISSQRGITFRTPCESLYAERIAGIKKLASLAREWRDVDESLQEED